MSRLADVIQNACRMTVTARNLSETLALGKELGELIEPGTVICLRGDLGSGKTSFVQGLALGLGVPEDVYVTSPSYTLVNEYMGRMPLYHLDLYRLNDPDELWDMGVDEMMANKGVVAVEWPDKLPPGMVSDHIRIDFEITPDDTRNLTFSSLNMDFKR